MRAAHTLTVAAPFMLYDGYGSMAEYLVRGLARAGPAVNVAPFDLDTAGLAPEFLDILATARLEIGGPSCTSAGRAPTSSASAAPGTCSSTRCGRRTGCRPAGRRGSTKHAR